MSPFATRFDHLRRPFRTDLAYIGDTLHVLREPLLIMSRGYLGEAAKDLTES
jgi:hypothetical protein